MRTITTEGKAYLCVERMAGEFSTCVETKTVRDKEGRGKHTPTKEHWVNSVNAGFKVAELLTKMNPQILFFYFESRILENRNYSIYCT